MGLGVPVGKDSLSMKTRWNDGMNLHQVTAPVSLIVTAFATLADVRSYLTPQLQAGDTSLIQTWKLSGDVSTVAAAPICSATAVAAERDRSSR